MEIRTTSEDPIQIHDDLPFVSSNNVTAGTRHTPAWEITGPDNYTLAIESNTPFAPEARESSGAKIDGSTRVVVQKADPQGNPLGNGIIFDHNMDAFDYQDMRSDPRFFRHTQKSVIIDEKEKLFVFLYIPSSANDFDASQSRLTLGDNVTETGKAVYIKEKSSMNQAERNQVQAASSK